MYFFFVGLMFSYVLEGVDQFVDFVIFKQGLFNGMYLNFVFFGCNKWQFQILGFIFLDFVLNCVCYDLVCFWGVKIDGFVYCRFEIGWYFMDFVGNFVLDWLVGGYIDFLVFNFVKFSYY